jgi:glycosyltransferase involved in cell wall biosynthesis
MCSGVKLFRAINEKKGFFRYFETFFILRRIIKNHHPDAYVLGFRGHEIFWYVRWMTRQKPLIFDALVSPSRSMRDENKFGPIGRLIFPMIHRMESWILRRSDLILTDTDLHADFYSLEFSIPRSKVLSVPVGAVELVQRSSVAVENFERKDFRVLFYGSFLALHGVNVIVGAAAKLKDVPIWFDFIGGKVRDEQNLRARCLDAGVKNYTHRRWVPFATLLTEEIPSADLCLGGPFGGTPQARRVITGKTSQCMALGKATVVGKIAQDNGFVDRKNCLLVNQNNPEALANAVRWAYMHRGELGKLGEAGRRLYDERMSLRVIGEIFAQAFRKIGIQGGV